MPKVKHNVAINLLHPTNEAHITPKAGPKFPETTQNLELFLHIFTQRPMLTYNGVYFSDFSDIHRSFTYEVIG